MAATHELIETDEGGLQYELSRDSISEPSRQIKVSSDNERRIAVLNELAR